MKVEKEKRKVIIFYKDNSWLKGIVYLNPGERLVDFLNDPQERFIPVTDINFFNIGEVRSFKLATEVSKKKDFIVINKTAIKFIEEVE